ncbi:protein arginine N-methyltransferase [Tritrichomonas foetus]|uniref:type I protein arginine methyltransferase n=1 Tax=Tritrichomonas foetus TaxID=1144522 RepID=A0A1J4JLG6_9EUKA|nr:protein arginine N-methyltransferase [Tritrichomonas foetus]|eukprot:OHS99952.1 protein arginine N-methyltransferase [Tritrichomonas foetus]
MNEDMMNKQSCDFYFDSYAHYSAHEDLLKDRTRTEAFKNAILQNPDLFRCKAVLDAGTGTGIFAMWAAQAGARVVYAVEKSSMADFAKKIIELNGFSSTVHVIHGALEEVELPEKVDVIICDYMGCCLLFDCMIPSFIAARDRFLKEGGVVFPSHSQLFVTGIEDFEYRSEKIGFWDNVYGFKYHTLQKVALVEPLVETCPIDGILSKEVVFKKFDMKTITTDDLVFTAPFELQPNQDNTLHAFVFWFDATFEGPQKSVKFTTSPYMKTTFYYQTVFYLNDPINVKRGVPVKGAISMKPNKDNERNEDIKIEFEEEGKQFSQCYLLKI